MSTRHIHDGDHCLNDRKCWTCEYCSCKRQRGSGLFSTPNTITFDTDGTCTNPRSSKNGKQVSTRYDQCYSYKRCALVEQFIQKIENDKKAKELEEQNNRARIDLENQEEESKRLQARLEEDKKRRAYNKWYSNLSEDDKAAEDKRVADEAEKKRRLEEQAKIEAARLAEARAEEDKKKAVIEEGKDYNTVKSRIQVCWVLGIVGLLNLAFNVCAWIFESGLLAKATKTDDISSIQMTRNVFAFFTFFNTIVFAVIIIVLLSRSLKMYRTKWGKPYKTKK